MISIIITVYNKCNTIYDTIGSVVYQLQEGDEIVIVDDGSTDHSIDIIKQFEASNVRIFSKVNGGESDARNYGILKAKNEWISFLDGDDQFGPNVVKEAKRVLAILDNKKTVLTFNRKHSYNGEIKDTTFIGIVKKSGHFVEKKDYYIVTDYFRLGVRIPVVTSSSIVVNKKAFSDCGFFYKTIKRGADREMWFRIFKEKYSLVIIKNVYSIINKTDTNRISQNIDIPYYHELAYLHKYNNTLSMRYYLVSHLLRRVVLSFRAKKYKQSFQLLSLLRHHVV